MPLISTRGAASAQGFGEFAQSAAPVYIEDVFSTYLYTGNGSTQTITNGIDLSGKGGLTWFKGRDVAAGHLLFDSARGVTKYLISNLTNAEATSGAGERLTAYNSNGFSLGTDPGSAINASGYNYASWTFRKQPKFFDVVTWTGDNVNGRVIPHSLNAEVGFIVVKAITTSANDNNWVCRHRSQTSPDRLYLNTTAAASGSTNLAPTTTGFTVYANGYNETGVQYVAYLFAHNAGGFGLSGTDNVISCGSYTGNGSTTGPVVTLGYEPQWLMVKRTDDVDSWNIADNMRGLFVGDTSTTANSPRLRPDLSNAEQASGWVIPTATGFQLQGPNAASGSYNASGGNYIYIAIRRGPMKVPTSGASVFSPIAYSGANGAAQNINAGFPVDADIIKIRNDGTRDPLNHARLMGGVFLKTDATSAEASFSDNIVSFSAGQNVIGLPVTGGGTNEINGASTSNYVAWAFRRAPGFMDVVCYTGTGVARTVDHNLAAVPELMIVKTRNATGPNWMVYSKTGTLSQFLQLDVTDAFTTSTNLWNSNPTSTQFSLAGSGTYYTYVNNNGGTYVAYLFATLAGVSKVGSYTGSGTTKQIDCGFTAGARFVLIKRTDSTGDWYVWDSARGIVASTDPYLVLNSTAAEVTTTDWVDTYSAGFELSSAAGNNVNINAASYIFLSIS